MISFGGVDPVIIVVLDSVMVDEFSCKGSVSSVDCPQMNFQPVIWLRKLATHVLYNTGLLLSKIGIYLGQLDSSLYDMSINVKSISDLPFARMFVIRDYTLMSS